MNPDTPDTTATDQATDATADTTAGTTGAAAELVSDALVEDVSIDGMCGVY